MKAKITRGKSFRGLLNYLLDHGRGEVIGGNMASADKIELSLEFGCIRGLRPDIAKPVWHCSLSLPPGDDLTLNCTAKLILYTKGVKVRQDIIVFST